MTFEFWGASFLISYAKSDISRGLTWSWPIRVNHKRGRSRWNFSQEKWKFLKIGSNFLSRETTVFTTITHKSFHPTPHGNQHCPWSWDWRRLEEDFSLSWSFSHYWTGCCSYGRLAPFFSEGQGHSRVEKEAVLVKAHPSAIPRYLDPVSQLSLSIRAYQEAWLAKSALQ